MPGSQDQFRINFSRGIFGINDQVLSENSKSHEFNSHHIAAARNAVQREFAFCVGDHRIFLAGQRVRGNHGRPGQRSFSAARGSADFVSGRCAVLCRGGQRAPAPKGARPRGSANRISMGMPRRTNFKSCSPRGSWVRRIVFGSGRWRTSCRCAPTLRILLHALPLLGRQDHDSFRNEDIVLQSAANDDVLTGLNVCHGDAVTPPSQRGVFGEFNRLRHVVWTQDCQLGCVNRLHFSGHIIFAEFTKCLAASRSAGTAVSAASRPSSAPSRNGRDFRRHAPSQNRRP